MQTCFLSVLLDSKTVDRMYHRQDARAWIIEDRDSTMTCLRRLAYYSAVLHGGDRVPCAPCSAPSSDVEPDRNEHLLLQVRNRQERSATVKWLLLKVNGQHPLSQ